MNDSLVLVTRQELDRLRRDSEKLSKLEAGGVDNWEGYDVAMADRSDNENY